jgi:hypothetical protein
MLHQISRNPSHNLIKVIIHHRPLGMHPKANIAPGGRVLGEGAKRDNPTGAVVAGAGGGELLEEARVLGPEEADVGNVEEAHGDAFEAETECPANVIFQA